MAVPSDFRRTCPVTGISSRYPQAGLSGHFRPVPLRLVRTWRTGSVLVSLVAGQGSGLPSECPILLGEGLAAGPSRFRGHHAVSAEAEFLGVAAAFLPFQAAVFHILRGLVPQPVILEIFFAFGFQLSRGKFLVALRLSGLCRSLSLGFAGEAFPRCLRCLLLLAGRPPALLGSGNGR